MATMEITTMVGCPLMCTFCPQDRLKSSYEQGRGHGEKLSKYLSIENFRIIVDKIPRHVRIDFSGMSEPWANPQCTEMLRYALQKGFNIAIYSTLFGLDGDEAEIVCDVLKRHKTQVQVICLHLPDANGNMRGWKPSYEWERAFLKFCQLKDEGIIPNLRLMTMHSSGKVHSELEHLQLALSHWTGDTVAGNVDKSQIEGQDYNSTPHHNSVVTCSLTPFYDHNVLLPNGDVALCCFDYGLKHILGNLLSDNYYDLFTSPELDRLRRLNMVPEFSKCTLCKSCPAAETYTYNDDSRWRSDRVNQTHAVLAATQRLATERAGEIETLSGRLAETQAALAAAVHARAATPAGGIHMGGSAAQVDGRADCVAEQKARREGAAGDDIA